MVERVVCACSLTVTIQLGAVLVFMSIFSISVFSALCLQCFDAVGWAAGRASGL